VQQTLVKQARLTAVGCARCGLAATLDAELERADLPTEALNPAASAALALLLLQLTSDSLRKVSGSRRYCGVASELVMSRRVARPLLHSDSPGGVSATIAWL
jgi:hypothetical protein